MRMCALFRIDGAVRYNGKAVPHGQVIIRRFVSLPFSGGGLLGCGNHGKDLTLVTRGGRCLDGRRAPSRTSRHA